MAPVGQLAFLMTRGRQAITTMASIQQMIEAGDERRMGSSALNLTIDTGNVAVEGLSFTYPGAAAPSLTDIDLQIEAGERIADVSRLASGKSTHDRMLCGVVAAEARNLFIRRLVHPPHFPTSFPSQL